MKQLLKGKQAQMELLGSNLWWVIGTVALILLSLYITGTFKGFSLGS